MAGVSRLQYTTEIRLVRVMCTGRVDLAHVLRAFTNGVDGVFIGGCRLNECNYITHGNYHALKMVYLCKRIMDHIGLSTDRLKIEFMSSGEGNLFVESVNAFVEDVKELGPLGRAEGLDEIELKSKLQAYSDMVPYIRLVDNEKLRVRFDQPEEYEKYFFSEEFDRLFHELIASKMQTYIKVNPVS